jgi:hypothetical protein
MGKGKNDFESELIINREAKWKDLEIFLPGHVKTKACKERILWCVQVTAEEMNIDRGKPGSIHPDSGKMTLKEFQNSSKQPRILRARFPEIYS